MSGCCSAMPRCPACHEPLAPKNLDITCGSCGHKFKLPPPHFPKLVVGALMGSLAILVLLLFFALQQRTLDLVRSKECWSKEMKSVSNQAQQLSRKVAALGAERNRLASELLERQSTPPPSSDVSSPGDDLDPAQLEADVKFLEWVVKLAPNEFEARIRLAAAYGLLDQNDKEIDQYEQALTLQPSSAEAHFRVSLAYDRSGRPDWSMKSFEHAKKAIKLDPTYKKRFQPMIRNSKVAKKVAAIIHEIIQKSENSQLPDEDAARYADEISRILGDENIKKQLVPTQPEDSGNLKDILKDPAKRQKLRQFWDSTSGTDQGPEPMDNLLEHPRDDGDLLGPDAGR